MILKDKKNTCRLANVAFEGYINIPSRRRPQVCLKGKAVDLGVAIETPPQL